MASVQKSKPDIQRATTCILCRRRKIKCDRTNPCGNCVRGGAECVPSIPSRAPRGRQGGRKKGKTDAVLLQRIARLEGLVKHIEGFETPPPVDTGTARKASESHTSSPGAAGEDVRSSPSQSGTTSRTGSIGGRDKPSKKLSVDRRHSSDKGLDRYLGGPFWATLSEEINGLKEVLGNSSTEDEEEYEDEPTSPSESSNLSHPQASHSGFVLLQNGPTEGLPVLTHHQLYIFCDVYLANFDRVFKLLHTPSLRKFLQERSKELACSPGFKGLEALKLAICYAAVTTLTDAECLQKTGEERSGLLAKYRAGTELALARADFVNTTEVSTLQALTIYLISVRANDTSRFSWTLIAVAVRIAQAIGLTHEHQLSAYTPFEREMRRRLWWQICILDFNSASDRATTSLISSDSTDTKMPLQINDEALDPDSLEEPVESEDFTDMTFCLFPYEACVVYRVLNFDISRQMDGVSQNGWNQRVEAVVKYQQLMDKKYLKRLDLSNPFHWATKLVSDCIMAGMWLLIYRPVQRRPDWIPPSNGADVDTLRLSLEVIERVHKINTDPAASAFAWLSHTYVQWHPIAVACAELCVRVKGPEVERAWSILEPFFTYTAERVADTGSGMLWRPVKKLMKRAREERQKYLALQQQLHVDTKTIQPNVGIANFGPIAADLNSQQIPELMDGVSLSGNMPQPVAPPSNIGPIDWNSWFNQGDPIGNGQGQQGYDSTNQMAWTSWEDFITETF